LGLIGVSGYNVFGEGASGLSVLGGAVSGLNNIGILGASVSNLVSGIESIGANLAGIFLQNY
jgi:hypothetical protein